MADSGRGQRFGPVAGASTFSRRLVTACDPVLVWQSRSVMTETPTAFLLAAALAALACRGWSGPVLGGLGLGLAALCRPSMLAGAVLTVLAAFLAKPGDRRQRLMRGGLLAADDPPRAFALDDPQSSWSSESPSGRPPTAVTPWRWPTTRCITTMSCTGRRAASGPGTTSGSGGTRSTERRPA